MEQVQAPALTVREAAFDVMRSFGADRIFGNPGSTELEMFREFPGDFTYVLGLQEAAVVGMADGYAQATGRVAFVNLHSAAGVGNAMGNIYTAFKNRTPLVIVAGQQSRSILPFDPYLASPRSAELPQPYVKWSIEPARAEDVPIAIAQACRIAMQHPRGPVFVSVPADDWGRAAEPVPAVAIADRVRPDAERIAALAAALADSKLPALVVGAEIDRSGAWEEMVELAERHAAAVYVAPVSARCAFPEDHPLFQGFLPARREEIVARLAPHDLVAVIGAPAFIYHVDGSGPHVPPATTLWQVTEDAASAARLPIGSAVIGDARLALRDLLAAPAPQPGTAPEPRKRPERVVAGEGPLDVAFVLQTLNDLRGPSDIVVEEAPTARIVMHEHLPMRRPGSFLTMASGGLGFGMPAAAGIAMAQPGGRVIALIGDGSAMYSLQSLWTAVQHELDVTFLILNNGRYAAMKRFGRVLGFPSGAILPGTDIPGIDFVHLATGHGCPGERVSDAADLPAALQRVLDRKGPALLEIITA